MRLSDRKKLRLAKDIIKLGILFLILWGILLTATAVLASGRLLT